MALREALAKEHGELVTPEQPTRGEHASAKGNAHLRVLNPLVAERVAGVGRVEEPHKAEPKKLSQKNWLYCACLVFTYYSVYPISESACRIKKKHQ